jgi:hypothetical protein
MTATTIVRQVKALLQVTVILISVSLVPVAVGIIGRSFVPNQTVMILDPQMDRPVFQW